MPLFLKSVDEKTLEVANGGATAIYSPSPLYRPSSARFFTPELNVSALQEMSSPFRDMRFVTDLVCVHAQLCQHAIGMAFGAEQQAQEQMLHTDEQIVQPTC